MEAVKRVLGIVWMLLGPGAIALMVWRAAFEIGENPGQENWIFWVIIITIFVPIAAGLSIFGFYSWKGYYRHLPTKSEEVD